MTKDIFPLVNAIVQTLSMGLMSLYGIPWGMYFVIGMLALLTGIQILAASAFFAGIVEDVDYQVENINRGLHILVNMLYFVSCYYLYLMGFVFLAGFFASHVAITMYTNFLRIIHQ